MKRRAHDADLKRMVVIRSPSPKLVPSKLYRFGQQRHFLSNRASLVGEWAEEAIDQLEAVFSAIIKELESKLLTGELDAQCQQRVTVQHAGFTCEADTLGSYGHVYLAIYSATEAMNGTVTFNQGGI
ncbi:type IV toxin-antitoxin system YeeU family antitoxin [Aeromonas veronii]|uniref:type IV toxin-antitoxin system YeeU family antitoxin n=1 Tax=Aeromonas veronii TaxID=654 RepID=UPI00406CDAAE